MKRYEIDMLMVVWAENEDEAISRAEDLAQSVSLSGDYALIVSNGVAQETETEEEN